jgi:hypothetical protein
LIFRRQIAKRAKIDPLANNGLRDGCKTDQATFQRQTGPKQIVTSLHFLSCNADVTTVYIGHGQRQGSPPRLGDQGQETKNGSLESRPYRNPESRWNHR